MSVPLPNVLQALALTTLVIYFALYWLRPLQVHAERGTHLILAFYSLFFFCTALTPYSW